MAQEFEMRCAAHKEARVVVAGAAVVKGEFDDYADLYGFYLADGAIGDEMAMVYQAEKVLVAKTAALAIAAGDKVYFNVTTRLLTKTNTDVLVGTCVAVAAAADSYALIDFDGREAFLKV